MAWTDDRAREEFAWLRLMARLKYDGYRDFQAGMRFIESLATWLQQFKPAERETAYDFVRRTLVYIGPSEMQRLVEQFYPRTVSDRLVHTIATRRTMHKYRVLADPVAQAEVDKLRRKTLFMALSDGARIDTVRHANVGLLTNEQLVVSTQLDTDKWQDLLQNLRDELKDPGAKFALVYLIDDFMGTGTSFLRFDDEKNKWCGKLIRFKDSVASAEGPRGRSRVRDGLGALRTSLRRERRGATRCGQARVQGTTHDGGRLGNGRAFLVRYGPAALSQDRRGTRVAQSVH